jgi:hypothetical protein
MRRRVLAVVSRRLPKGRKGGKGRKGAGERLKGGPDFVRGQVDAFIEALDRFGVRKRLSRSLRYSHFVSGVTSTLHVLPFTVAFTVITSAVIVNETQRAPPSTFSKSFI